MADYLVGIIANLADAALAKFLFQSNNLQMEADEYEAKDEKGNTARVQHINHRVTCDVEAIIPAKVAVPFIGQVVKLSGLSLPTVAADGTVTGTFKVDPTVSTEFEFKINGTVNISQSNQDFIHCSFTAIRYLANGIPNTQDSDSDND